MSYTKLYTHAPKILSGDGIEAGAILGVPYDSTHTYRPGCRFAPDYIRELYNNIEVFHSNLGVDLEAAHIRDMGNLYVTVDSTSLIKMVRRVVSETIQDKIMPVLLGGEHLLTLGSYMACEPGTCLVILDAHYDLRDNYADTRLNHATFLRRIVEERGSSDILHVGGRACASEEMAFIHETGIQTVPYDPADIRQMISRIAEFVRAYDRTYLSLDMDVVDPAYCPGVGNPEGCGMTSHDMIKALLALSDADIVGADIVELNPVYDNGSGGALAAKALSTILAMGISQRG